MCSRKWNNESVLLKFNLIHNNTYEYGHFEFSSIEDKIDIKCLKHGIFKQSIKKHMYGQGCRKCSTEISSIKYRLSKSVILERFNQIYNDKYLYDDFEYINNKSVINIKCSEHGYFKKTVSKHLSGQGCPTCSKIIKKIINRNKFIKQIQLELIDRFKIIHNDKYIYNEFDYSNNLTKIDILCKEHGIFNQTIQKHLIGQGCKKCGLINAKNKMILGLDTFINRSNIIHDNKYLYNNVDYINSIDKVDIICKKHGLFKQTPNKHLIGRGCPKCKNDKLSHHFRLDVNKFIKDSNYIHNNKYTYENVVYVNNNTKVDITCSKHGSFLQTPNEHKDAVRGCPKCNTSYGELEVEKYLESNNIEYIQQKTFTDCVYINKLRFDFYLPEYNICIEYDGKQHFEPIEYFGGENGFNVNKTRDDIKESYCISNKIELIRIPYYDIEYIPEILKVRLFN